MKFLLTTFGSHGDLFPFLAIGRALKARGHSVRLATHEVFAPDIRAAGIEPVPAIAGIPLEALLRHPDLYHRVRGPLLGARHYGRMMVEFARDLRGAIDASRPDAIVGHYGSFSARWVARERGIPYVSLALTPMAWNSPGDPVPAWESVSSPAGRALLRMASGPLDAAMRAFTMRWLTQVRRDCGVSTAERTSIWDEFRLGDRALGLWPAALRPPLPGDPAGSCLTGFPRDPDREPAPDPRLEAFLDEGPPPVVFTLGSAAVNHPQRFFEWSAEACRRLGLRGVLLVGRENPVPAGLPADVLAIEWAAHARLFPRSLLNVHHGGIGTTGEALASGRPALVIPHAFDQFNNALRVERLGPGAMVSRHHLDLASLVRALDRVRSDVAMAARAAGLAAGMRTGGPLDAATAIESVARGPGAGSAAA